MTNEEAKNRIPKLPRGMGSITWIEKRNKYVYKRTVEGVRKSVYGDTINEVMSNMENFVKKAKREESLRQVMTLGDAMMNWLEVYKKNVLKDTSYDTLRKTIEARIVAYPIGKIRLSTIDPDMLQQHINSLNGKARLSYSTIKKCYDALNEYFRVMVLQGKLDNNPMLTVTMINKEQIIKETKKIEFLDQADINKFIAQAEMILDWSGKPQYQYGFCLAANIYMGMRAGELLALKWRDVDFKNNTIYVHENLQLVRNPKADEQGEKKQIYKTQSLKNYQNRHIHINRKAQHFLKLQFEYSPYTNPDDYVCCTRDGKHAAVTYLSNNIAEIERAAKTKVVAHGTHVIRHTCASLYFRKGVKIELIASLLGHSVDVCRETYIHFVEEQKKMAVELIDDYEVDE